MYKRKTYDEYQIQAHYGYGWDCVFADTSAKNAKKTLKAYQSNEKALFRIMKKRIKND